MNECENTSVHSDEDICFAIVETVSNVTGIDPLELDPLGSVVDTDALGALFSPSSEMRQHDAYLTFRYEGCNVSVDSDGSVTVTHVPAEAAFDHTISVNSDANSSVGDRGDANCR